MKENIRKDLFKKLKSFAVLAAVLCTTACESTRAAEVSAGQKPAVTSPAKEKSPDVIFAEKLKAALRSGSTEDALLLFETMPASLQGDIDMKILQASLLLSVGRTAEASAIADQLAVKDPGNIDVAELSLYIAKITGNEAGRKEQLQKILTANPKDSEANIELAGEALTTNNYAQAQKYYETALSGDTENIDAMLGLGVSYYYLNKPSDAENTFNNVLKKDSTNAQALSYLGKMAAEKDRYRAALGYAQRAAESDPGSYDIFLDLGTYYRQLLKLEDAEKAWTHAISIAPDFFLAYAYRANLYDEMNELHKAYVDYKKVIETNPKYFYAYESLGMLAWHEGDYENSFRSFQKALALNTDNISYVLMMAVNLKKLGRDADFKKFLEQQMKKQDRSSVEYSVTRLFHDDGGINAENATLLKIRRETDSTKRGKFSYYMGLFYDLQGKPQLAADLYSDVLKMQHPLFFEYRLAEWSMQK